MAEIEKESYPEVSNHNLEATVNVDFTVVESTEVADAEIGKDFLQTYTARMVETGVARARVTIRWNYTVVYRNREGER